MKWKKAAFAMCLSFLIGFTYSGQGHAHTISQESVDGIVEEAAAKQRLLMEGTYTVEEIKEIMQPYFTDQFINVFMEETMFEEDGFFQMLGTDFAPHIIPPLESDAELEECAAGEGERICLYGYYPAYNDGPVGYESHYEAVILKNEDGKWKIDGIDYDYTPNSNQNEPETVAVTAAGHIRIPSDLEADHQNASFFQPLATLFSVFSFIGR